MATTDVSRPWPADPKMACERRNRTAKAAWWAAAERIDTLSDLISDISYATVAGRESIARLQSAAADMDRAIGELTAVKAVTAVQS